MDFKQFIENVESHEDLEGVGIDLENRILVVRHKPSDLTTSIPAGAVDDIDWDTLLDVFTGKREPQALRHMTRVVGYYSRTENWNKSKIGELRDRRKGEYSID